MTEGTDNRRNERRAYFTFEDVARVTGQTVLAVRRDSRLGRFVLEDAESFARYVGSRLLAGIVVEVCDSSGESEVR